MTNLNTTARIWGSERDPAALAWQEAQKVAHYSLAVGALSRVDRR